jgi:hypothetical protein
METKAVRLFSKNIPEGAGGTVEGITHEGVADRASVNPDLMATGRRCLYLNERNILGSVRLT